ncbi:hypothetical protein [Rossellomorea sp. LjRoot5]|uniref:hypothetical protein n=1 Tax=Rossellomorea sp. LjRoot5 TaxID=3342331 RepID=UPI003F5020DF
MALHNEKKSALLYSAWDIEVLRDEEVPSHPFISKVGPDLLSEHVTSGGLTERMKDKRFRNRKWSILLLDQGFVAGIGNYLRSEIMFVAGIHPSLRPVDCTEDQLNNAAHAVMSLVKQSYKTGGITNDPDLAQKLKDKGVKRSGYRHWVFNREAESCFICGSEIEKMVAASRRLYHCPVCQSIK